MVENKSVLVKLIKLNTYTMEKQSCQTLNVIRNLLNAQFFMVQALKYRGTIFFICLKLKFGRRTTILIIWLKLKYIIDGDLKFVREYLCNNIFIHNYIYQTFILSENYFYP